MKGLMSLDMSQNEGFYAFPGGSSSAPDDMRGLMSLDVSQNEGFYAFPGGSSSAPDDMRGLMSLDVRGCRVEHSISRRVK